MLSGLIFLVFPTIFIAGEPSLLIYETVNGTDHPITAYVRVTNGNNLTLNCLDLTSSQNKVSWSKKSKFYENHIPSYDSSKISFTPAKTSDDGVYVCTSIKSNLSRPISIVVYGGDPQNNRRLKRTKQEEFEKLYKNGNNFPSVGSDDPVGDFFKNNKAKPTSPPSWLDKHKDMLSNFNIEESENWPSYIRPGSNWYTSNLASGNVPSHSNTIFDDLYKKTDEKVVETPDSPIANNEFTILYCMVVFGGMLLFAGIVCMCVRNDPSVRARFNRTSSDNPPCTHAMCVRHRDTNPLAGCILSTLNATNRIPTPMVHTNEDGDVTVLTFPNDNIDSIDFEDMIDVIDTPPSYSNTVDDIKSDLPPSYDEVLQNMLPPSYSSYQSTSTAIDALVSQSDVPLVNDV